MTPQRFRDRAEAGRRLAEKLAAYANRQDVLVLALPRGGVPVAFEVARSLGAPLDVFVVRKLGVPGHEELAMGAVATGGVRVLNEDIVHGLGIPDQVIDAVVGRELQELSRRERLYHDGRAPPDVKHKTVILVDDGLATGATMRAAVQALKQQHPDRIVIAVPTASADTCEALRGEADDVVCAATPDPFLAVGYWYDDFAQTSDVEVRNLLARRESRGAPPRDGSEEAVAAILRDAAVRLSGRTEDYERLLDRIGDARLVLLGEASHGTHEFYRERARITRMLIEEKGFAAVAVEADWPDAYRVNRFVRNVSDDPGAAEALGDFGRFPRWMWRNTEVAEFIEWLRARNDRLSSTTKKTGFYGLDLYSLHTSMRAVLQYLERVDPEAARRAGMRYACFDHFGPDPQVYGFVAATDTDRSCRDQVVAQLVEMHQRTMEQAMGQTRGDARIAEDELFFAEQNARLVKNAESYYRSMFFEDTSSWNLRDRHMVETLEALMGHLSRRGAPAKIVVWAHNSHLGDARATEIAERGELNVGQLVREKYRGDAALVGFTTDHGTVTAASNWGGPAERKNVRPALAGSWEALFHSGFPARFLLTWRADDAIYKALRGPCLERAIGVIYRPATERASHYFKANLADQFDAVLHFDETRAVEPLDDGVQSETGEVPETFPFAV
jgi:erythromycin esterase-like protein/adenine/guanine phosphoribosyltransferase-like PRPP-binding protein